MAYVLVRLQEVCHLDRLFMAADLDCKIGGAASAAVSSCGFAYGCHKGLNDLVGTAEDSCAYFIANSTVQHTACAI